MSFWRSDAWLAYEVAYGDPPGTRAALLERADWQTRVVDLTPNVATLWRDVRQSYHALINGLARDYPDLATEDHPTRARTVLCGPGAGGLIRTAQRVHAIDAGRQTRSDATWDLLGDWADAGRGLLVMAFDYAEPTTLQCPPAFVERDAWRDERNACAGFVYFAVAGSWAYYFSAATLRRNLNLALVWWALLALKARGVTRCELGWQGQATDDKGRAVEFFKRGFGGIDVPARDGGGL